MTRAQALVTAFGVAVVMSMHVFGVQYAPKPHIGVIRAYLSAGARAAAGIGGGGFRNYRCRC